MGIRANGQYFLGHFLFFLFSSSVLDFFVGHSSITSACAGAVVLSHLSKNGFKSAPKYNINTIYCTVGKT